MVDGDGAVRADVSAPHDWGRWRDYRMTRYGGYGDDQLVVCKTCGRPTDKKSTELCDWCWEVEHRLNAYLRDGSAAAMDVLLGSLGMSSVRDQLAAADSKWREYERDYILPCFRWAAESGLDLEKAVRDNPGKNCVELLVRWLQARACEAETFAGVIDGVRAALGQQATHHLVVTGDVEELVRAVELCASDGGCRAMAVLEKLRGRA